jgi:hypothetical protein
MYGICWQTLSSVIQFAYTSDLTQIFKVADFFHVSIRYLRSYQNETSLSHPESFWLMWSDPLFRIHRKACIHRLSHIVYETFSCSGGHQIQRFLSHFPYSQSQEKAIEAKAIPSLQKSDL